MDLKEILDIKRRRRDKAREAARKVMDALVKRQWTGRDMLQIFALALKAKLSEKPTRYQMTGRNTGRHHEYHFEHPAGTKLVRRFIRQGRGEQVEYRRIYARLTGHHYQRAE